MNTVPPMQSVLMCSIICFPASCFAFISRQTFIQYSLTSTSTGTKLNKEKVNDLYTSRAPWHRVCYHIRYILNLLRVMLDAHSENKCCGDANLVFVVVVLNVRFVDKTTGDLKWICHKEIQTQQLKRYKDISLFSLKCIMTKSSVKRNLLILHINNSRLCWVCLGNK